MRVITSHEKRLLIAQFKRAPSSPSFRYTGPGLFRLLILSIDSKDANIEVDDYRYDLNTIANRYCYE
jgi:hypothetical protein